MFLIGVCDEPFNCFSAAMARSREPTRRALHGTLVVAVAVGIVGGGDDEEPLEYLKATDIVEEGNGGESPLCNWIKVHLFAEFTSAVEVSLNGIHCCCDGAAQGRFGDARSWRPLNGSRQDVREFYGAWDNLDAL